MPYAEDWAHVASDYGTVAHSPIVGPQMNWGAVQGGAGFTPTAREYSAVPVGDMAGVDVARIDPTAAIQAAQRHLSTISSPEIRNALQASGLGRSGAEAEALAREGVRLELPIQQQILQSDAQANQLEATIQANQQQVRFLEQQKAHLQAQALSAQSYEQAQQIQAQLATVDQQINAALAQAEFAGQTQQAIAQRQAQLNYGSNMLGQAANLMGQQYAGQVQFGNQVLGNLTQMGLGLPALQNQAYQNALQGAQTQLQAASLPQQMAMQDYQNLMNYNLSLLGATPLPSMNFPGVTSQASQPGAMDYLGTAALIGSQFVPRGG
jgi:hypothetical protein